MSKQFEQIIRSACDVESQIRDLQGNTRLTAKAIIEGCLARADSNMEKLDKLREMLEERIVDMRHAWAFVRQTEKWFQEGRINSGVPQSVARMSLPSRTEAQQDLASLGGMFTLYELWSLAAQRVSKRHPEVFGSVQDPFEHQWQLDSLREKRAELLEKIPTSFDASDLEIGQIGPDGRALIGLKIAPDVPLVPLRDLGRRLVDHLLSTEPKRWTVKHEPVRNNRGGKMSRSELSIAGS